MIPKNLVHFAQAHARAILRGTMTPLDIVVWVKAMKGEVGQIASALYVLEVASLVPDSIEVQLRKVLTEVLES